jgi:hypothetical protein
LTGEIVLPLHEVSFEKQLELLKGFYVKSNKGKNEVSYKEVSEIVKLSPTRTSGCIKFYESIGLLVRGSKRGKYTPSKTLCDFFVKLSYAEHVEGKEDEAKLILHEEFKNIWFTKQILQYFELYEISKKMDLLINLADKAKVELDNRNKRSLTVILNWLSYLNLIERDETGNYKLTKDAREMEMLSKRAIPEEEKVEPVSTREITAAKEYQYTINFAISVTPETTKEDLEKMTKLIREFMEEKPK